VERCPDDNNRYNNSHSGFVEQCPDDNNMHNNSHRGFANGVQFAKLEVNSGSP
jgi:hypothetical protein